jgi:HAMP domain-containing protein
MMHAALGLVVLVSVALAVNWTVWFLVLRPIDRIRDRMHRMTRGEWRTTTNRTSDDEIGQFTADFDRLGLAVEALAGQLLYAERLATLALVSKRLEASILPQVQRIVAAVSRVQVTHDRTVERLEEVTDASTRIVASLRALDRLFKPGSPRRAVSAVPRPLQAGHCDRMPIQPSAASSRD